jgi:hypothetical protein
LIPKKIGNTKLSLAGDYFHAPQITKTDQKRPTLTSKTTDQDAWPELQKDINNHESICLKPASELASPDIIFALNGWLVSEAV